MARRGARPLSRGVLWVGGLALLLAAGCGPRFGNVSGTVTYKGQPLAGGTITFYDAANHATSGEIKPDGTYTVSRVALGRARITVAVPMNIQFVGLDKGVKKDAGAAKPPTLPGKYADPDKSGLVCDVSSTDHKHDVTLD